MDREFMKSFLQNYYTDYESEAVKDSAEYQESKKRRYEIEEKFELMLQDYSKELVGLFDDYLNAYTDEMEFLLQEVYLQGAQDREKMLRGII